MTEKTEILIDKNPMNYHALAPEAFDALIQDGSWIPLVFGAIEAVVNRRFYDLCALDWDYLRPNVELANSYSVYKGLRYKGLNDDQTRFAREVGDEIEREIISAANDAAEARKAECVDD